MNKKLLVFSFLIMALLISSAGCIENSEKNNNEDFWFKVTDLKVNPKKAHKNQNITITANVKNTETKTNELVLDLITNGETVDTYPLELVGNEEKGINFTVSKGYGNYTVKIGEETTNFNIGGVIIKKVNYDPPGKDIENLNGEWVEIQNKWNHPVNLDGWYIFDYSLENDVKYFFKNFTLQPNATVKVHNGEGNDTKDHLYWNWNEPIWGNRADLAHLYNETGKRVDTYHWITNK
ncbi:hypothetical protein C9439_06615 [archaeon SCG-AAA382B04]|nr:hypothetical protein C9439_06615 [archaeon SCG-AAA382B04]